MEEEERTKRHTAYGAVASVAEVVAPICKQNRTRTIERQPTTGGRQCKGEGFDERFCSDTDCQGKGNLKTLKEYAQFSSHL